MDEKLIVISIEDEIVDSFIGTVGFANSSEYYLNNKIEPESVLEFEAFVFVDCKWR
jgi:hypothetical protein